jgi:hypothetical protein
MIEVRITGKGTVRGEDVSRDTTLDATCSLCNASVDAVASVGVGFACKTCLRKRLEAMTLGAYVLDSSTGLPWGKVTS